MGVREWVDERVGVFIEQDPDETAYFVETAVAREGGQKGETLTIKIRRMEAGELTTKSPAPTDDCHGLA